MANWALAGIVLIGGLLRATLLQMPIRGDEAVTYIWFARFPILTIARTYEVPNNHILHSMAAHVSVKWFGLSEIALRLPALLFGFMVIVLVYRVGVRIYRDQTTGLVAALFASLSWALINYSANARGYMLQAAFLLGMILTAEKMLSHPRLSYAVVWALCGVGLMYTVPTGVLFWIAAALSLLVTSKSSGRVLAWWSGVLTVCAVLVLYLPVAREMFDLSGTIPNYSSFGEAARMIFQSIEFAGMGFLPQSLFVIAVALGLGKGCPTRIKVLYGVLSVGIVIVVLLGRVHVEPHRLLPVFPLLVVTASAGLLRFLRALSGIRTYGRPLVAVAAGLLLVFLAERAMTVVRNPAALYLPDPDLRERALLSGLEDRTIAREMVRKLARGLQKTERLLGVDQYDGLAWFYTVEQRGFKGLYGVLALDSSVRTVYLIGKNSELEPFIQRTFVEKYWLKPRWRESVGNLSLVELWLRRET